VGKHFSVNMMIQKDSVRSRLESREQGISYTEFSYMLLQAYDFLHLHDAHGVTLQMAGSDQWGNIVAGIDLIRRTRQTETFGLTAPLITKADGGKFGKTEAGAIWLTPDRTSPYDFYQFWVNAADADVGKFLRTFTMLDQPTIDRTLAEHEAAPQKRIAQLALAESATEMLHGPTALAEAKAATAALFSGDVRSIAPATLRSALKSAPTSSLAASKLDGEGMPIVDFLVETEIAKSKREARELVTAGSIQISGKVATPETRVTHADLIEDLAPVRRGKKTWHVVRAG
jgi:tyrosyl-tRNA synthetase